MSLISNADIQTVGEIYYLFKDLSIPLHSSRDDAPLY